MSLHVVHFIGPINATSACTIRKLCLQAPQNGATGIALHMSPQDGIMDTARRERVPEAGTTAYWWN